MNDSVYFSVLDTTASFPLANTHFVRLRWAQAAMPEAHPWWPWLLAAIIIAWLVYERVTAVANVEDE